MSLVESLYDASSACLDFYFFSPYSYEWEKKNNMLLFSALGGKVKQIIVLGSAAMILVGRRRE